MAHALHRGSAGRLCLHASAALARVRVASRLALRGSQLLCSADQAGDVALQSAMAQVHALVPVGSTALATFASVAAGGGQQEEVCSVRCTMEDVEGVGADELVDALLGAGAHSARHAGLNAADMLEGMSWWGSGVFAWFALMLTLTSALVPAPDPVAQRRHVLTACPDTRAAPACSVEEFRPQGAAEQPLFNDGDERRVWDRCTVTADFPPAADVAAAMSSAAAWTGRSTPLRYQAGLHICNAGLGCLRGFHRGQALALCQTLDPPIWRD
jgi:heme exporter protein D